MSQSDLLDVTNLSRCFSFSSATVDLLDPNQSSLATLREELHASQLREEKS